ncbi:hypothetical protein NQ315_009462 [Exocentrus adspersus]|uniref:SIFamide n=1 Tax=Exocentrus adspersus TaxID=1586481 RepID=A0AAV8WGS2_9CUCU|nr:hypothetical protein NQ315_009462 [Exocentrus adspersus]
MSGHSARTLIILCVAIFFACAVITMTEASYRKPPFNGSIFGKRTGPNNEYEGTSKALSAMCEIANEACQSWFPITQEK